MTSLAILNEFRSRYAVSPGDGPFTETRLRLWSEIACIEALVQKSADGRRTAKTRGECVSELRGRIHSAALLIGSLYFAGKTADDENAAMRRIISRMEVLVFGSDGKGSGYRLDGRCP
jgi:hypothetical protein